MLKLKDKTGKIKFIVRDDDTGPIDPDTLVLQDLKNNDDDEEDEQPEKEE